MSPSVKRSAPEPDIVDTEAPAKKHPKKGVTSGPHRQTLPAKATPSPIATDTPIKQAPLTTINPEPLTPLDNSSSETLSTKGGSFDARESVGKQGDLFNTFMKLFAYFGPSEYNEEEKLTGEPAKKENAATIMRDHMQELSVLPLLSLRTHFELTQIMTGKMQSLPWIRFRMCMSLSTVH